MGNLITDRTDRNKSTEQQDKQYPNELPFIAPNSIPHKYPLTATAPETVNQMLTEFKAELTDFNSDKKSP
ncbi:hypothetical protein TUM3794_13890 [Shewanella colwelliana]|uniref:Uncharacterized protein n=1 Tax=Shewanella colwelliana TaxID=23 RepID=A0ABQ4NXL4_SHECO|nr:hypothetical protein TUM3794_13890 [Shewanella colwelliana]